MKLTGLIRLPTPEELAALRRFFHGTFTPPQAEITAVTGRVLSFDMTATQPCDFPDLVDYNGLGVDICP